MLHHNVFNFRKFCLLCSFVMAIGFTVGLQTEAKGQNAKGCNPTPGEPVPNHALPPCKSGVPDKNDVVPIQFACKAVGTAPNQTCHWMYEDRLGCDGGGAGVMCDTIATGGGATECSCEPVN